MGNELEELAGLAHPERVYVNLEQRTEAWQAVRLGKITGTDFSKIAPEGAQAWQVFCDKAAARSDPMHYEQPEMFINANMLRGIAMESHGREAYGQKYQTSVLEVGFVDYLLDDEFTGWCGCSPDGLVGRDGIIEIKCPTDENFLLQRERLPLKYLRQAMFNTWVTQRQWCDFVLYGESGDLHIRRLSLDMEWRTKIENIMRSAIGEIQKIICGLTRTHTRKRKQA
jgi:hypothetical protein